MNHRHIKITVLLLTLIFMLGACRTKMGVVKSGTPESADFELIRSVLQVQDPETGWELKAAVRVEMDDEKQSGILTVRMEDDRRIWVSFRSGLGIEVARAFATPDSIWISSRLLKIAEKGNWNGLKDLIGIPLDFHVLKAILTRQLDTGINGNRWKDPAGWKITNSDESRWMESGLNGDRRKVEYRARYMIESPGPVIREMVFDDLRHMWNIRIRYEGDDTKGIDRMNLVMIDHNQNADIQLKYLSVEKKKSLDMPFEFF